MPVKVFVKAGRGGKGTLQLSCNLLCERRKTKDYKKFSSPCYFLTRTDTLLETFCAVPFVIVVLLLLPWASVEEVDSCSSFLAATASDE